jgi:hypothetical protein
LSGFSSQRRNETMNQMSQRMAVRGTIGAPSLGDLAASERQFVAIGGNMSIMSVLVWLTRQLGKPSLSECRRA